MFRKWKISAKTLGIVVIISLLVFIGVVSFTYNEERKLSPIEKFVKDSVVTLQEFIYAPVYFVTHSIDQYNELINMYDEYTTLKSELDKHAMVVARKEELEEEVKHLKETLELEKVMTDYKLLNATVVFRDVDGWHDSIVIDRGTFHGVKKNMAVISSKGVIGRVSKVNELTSEVKLITAQTMSNQTSALIQSKTGEVNGLIFKYDPQKNEFTFRSVDSSIEVQSGDLVVTSGYGDLFPRGILIGEVISVEKDQYDLSQIVQIKPSAQFQDIRYVTLIESVK